MSLMPARYGYGARNIAAHNQIERPPLRQRFSRAQEKDHLAPRILARQLLETFRDPGAHPALMKLPNRVVLFPSAKAPSHDPFCFAQIIDALPA